MSAEPAPREPVTPVRPEPRGAPDKPPPNPPRELERDDGLVRRFELDGVDWVVRPAGKGAGGTGAYGLGMIEAVHFAHASSPETPLFEALLAAGRIACLFDEELCAVLRGATPIVVPDGGRPPREARTRRLRDQ